MIKVKTFYLNDLRECCYILYNESKGALIVDPGLQSNSEKERIVKFIEENNLKPEKILCTHGHFDHIMGNAFVSKKWGVPTYIHNEDLGQLERAMQYCQMFGYTIEQPPTDNITFVCNGDIIELGDDKIEVLHTPGHTRGGVCYLANDDNFVITGDTLFCESIGRTDLPGGDYDALKDSLMNKLCKLNPETVVYPGHGPSTTISHEIVANPFLEF